MKVAIVHYWFTTWRGGERVVEALLKMYPEADVYAHVVDPELVAERIPEVRVRETFIARLPWGRRLFRYYLPLMPHALEALDLQAYDLIISSESGPAKGIIKRPDAVHVCYCHTPMRYLWDLSAQYRRRSGRLAAAFLTVFGTRLRAWDVSTSHRVDAFVANSGFVARRIEAFYRRESRVVPPPVRTDRIVTPKQLSTPYYVVAGELVDYKRADLAIAAANALGCRLVVVGEGGHVRQLRKLAGPTVEFVGRIGDDEFAAWIAGARALIYPGLEDFGMVPVEALALGTPLIAYANGGALEYLIEDVNGVGFMRQDVDSLIDAIRQFEQVEPRLSREGVRETAQRFSAREFERSFSLIVGELLECRNWVQRSRAPQVLRTAGGRRAAAQAEALALRRAAS